MRCFVSGPVKDATGTLLASQTITIQRSPFKGAAQDAALILPRDISIATDANGLFEGYFEPGVYVGRDAVGRAMFVMTVPDAALADLSSCVDAPAIVDWPDTVKLAVQAQAAAEVAALTAQSAANSSPILPFTDRAALVTYVASNTLAANTVVRAEGIAWRFVSYAVNTITDMAGFVPDDAPKWRHWGADPTGATSSTAAAAAAYIYGYTNKVNIGMGLGTFKIDGPILNYNQVGQTDKLRTQLYGEGPGLSVMALSGTISDQLFCVTGNDANRGSQWFWDKFAIVGDDTNLQNIWKIEFAELCGIGTGVTIQNCVGQVYNFKQVWGTYLGSRATGCGNSFRLPYDACSVAFTTGQRVVGQTSGATAHILWNETAGSTGTLHLSTVTGTFVDNEALRSDGTIWPGNSTNPDFDGVVNTDGSVVPVTGVAFANIPTGIQGAEQATAQFKAGDSASLAYSSSNNLKLLPTFEIVKSRWVQLIIDEGGRKISAFGCKFHPDNRRNYDIPNIWIKGGTSNTFLGVNIGWHECPAVWIETTANYTASENTFSGGCNIGGGIKLIGATQRNVLTHNNGTQWDPSGFVTMTAGADNVVGCNSFKTGRADITSPTEVSFTNISQLQTQDLVHKRFGPTPTGGWNTTARLQASVAGSTVVASLFGNQTSALIEMKDGTTTVLPAFGALANDFAVYTAASGNRVKSFAVKDNGSVVLARNGAALVMSDSAGTSYSMVAQVGAPPTWGGTALVDVSTAQTLTNKSISLGSNTVTATKAQLNTAVTDGDVVFVGDGIQFSVLTSLPTTLAGHGIGDAVDLSSTQTISGIKTFSGAVSFTGTETLIDSGFTLADDVDTTKKVQFQMSGVTTGTTRTLTVPDASGTLALLNLAAGQTFTTPVTFSSGVVLGTYTTGGPYTYSIGSQASASGQTKTINIGTSGLSGSTTTITIGPSAGAGTVAVQAGVTAFSMGGAALLYKCAAPVTYSASQSLVVADLTAPWIAYTGAAANLTLPTGTTLDAGLPSIMAVDNAIKFSVINTGSGAATLVANTGVTIIGSAAIAAGTSGRFFCRKTATATYQVARIA